MNYNRGMKISYCINEKINGCMMVDNINQRHPLIILCHGFGSSYKALEVYAKAFMEQGYACFLFDFCGGSVDSKSIGNMWDMSVKSECEDLEEVYSFVKELDYIDSHNVYLLGESQGGYVCAYMASKYTEINGLILFYPGFNIQDFCIQKYNDGLIEKDSLFGFPLGKKYILDGKEIDIYKEIGKYRKKVCIIHGNCDRIVPLSYSKKAVQLYKNASLHIIDGARHGFYGNQIEEVIQHCLHYLEDTLLQAHTFNVNGYEVNALYSKLDIENVYKPLCRRWYDLYKEKGHRILVYVSACPGSGKSTFVQFLDYIFKQMHLDCQIQVIGMDGFHFYDSYLIENDLKKEKGSPRTFDVQKLKSCIQKTKEEGCWWPIYSREIHDPVEDAIYIDGDIVLIEGNYLLSNEGPWDALETLCDDSLFIYVDKKELEDRLILRKAKGGLSLPMAKEFYKQSDGKNVDYVLAHRKPSCVEIEWENNRIL